MIRILLYVIKAALLVGIAVWLAEHPGRVAMEWQGWRIDTNLAVLAGFLVLVLAATLILYRFWRFAREGAYGWHQRRQAKRLHSGYQAFTEGMIALAAGDTRQARSQARKTLALTDRHPLGLLLRVQAAQIEGDESQAHEALRAMLERPETTFLALRSLTAMALRAGALDEALSYAERAHTLQPHAHWPLQTLVDLRIRQEKWDAALEALEAAGAAKLWDKDRLNRRRAVILLGQGQEAARAQDISTALNYAEKAVQLATDLIPASLLKAKCLLALERPGKAAVAIERIWISHPHPDLARLYIAASKSQDALAQFKHCQALLALAPNAVEGHLAMGDAARSAGLWQEARRFYRTAAADPLTRQRACLGLASVEETDRGNLAEALSCAKEAIKAPAGPVWRCGSCGTQHESWRPHCLECGEIDGIYWTGEEEHTKPSRLLDEKLR